MENLQPFAKQMTPLQVAFSKAKGKLFQWRRRFLPYLVWYDDELDVRVTFKENKLPEMEMEASPESFGELMGTLNRGSFHECEKLMSEVGISFDKGMGLEGRDWEWDWSLRGPISVKFVGRAQNPERRH